MITVRKKYSVIPAFTYGQERGGIDHNGTRLTGTCIFVHPANRFAVLEFPFYCGTIRESFRPDELKKEDSL